MTSHVLDPLRTIARAIRRAVHREPQPDPLLAMFKDGLDVPPHLIGRDINLIDSEGRIVATTRRPVDPTIAGMLG